MLYFTMSSISFEPFKKSFEHKEIFLAGIAFLKKTKIFIQTKDISGEKEQLLSFNICDCCQSETLFESLLENWLGKW